MRDTRRENALDFVIVGAQKSATTSLFEILKNHPLISLPIEKEVPFFSGDDFDPRLWPRFMQCHFDAASPGQILGKISPQYMCDRRVAGRLAGLMPEVRVIAILRDPIERSWSHFQMGKRRMTEERDFSGAVRELLEIDAQEKAVSQTPPTHADGYESEGDFYLAWSEYGRQLTEFYQHFSSDQILVLFTEDLKRDPQLVIDRVLAFIGLASGYSPANLSTRSHQGGGGMKISHNVREWFRQCPPVGWLWSLVPPRIQGRIRFKYEQWNISGRDDQMPLCDDLRQLLYSHFARDLNRLNDYVELLPEWKSRYRLDLQ